MARLYKVNSESGFEPILLSEAKNFCKIDSDITADDTLIEELITSARIYSENYCNRAFKAKNITIRLVYEDLYNDKFPLKFRANPTGLTITKYYEGSSSTISTDIYQLNEFENAIELKYNQEWDDFDYMDITYDVYVDSNELIKRSMLNIIYEDYEYRMNGKPRNRNRVNAALDQYRLFMFK